MPQTLPAPLVPQAAPANRAVSIVQRDDDSYVLIEDPDRLPPFFCSLTSDADLWVFVSSTGALTAGRRDPEEAILPYETVDKIHDCTHHTGPAVALRWRGRNGEYIVWEPLRGKAGAGVKRRLLKNTVGTRLVFEEEHSEAGLSLSTTLMISPRFGLVREYRVRNLESSPRRIEVCHGLRNILPAGVTRRLQNELSCLVDAYKQGEILSSSGVGVYSMASGVTDQPVPFEVLRATVVWSCGLGGAQRSLDPVAWERFLDGLAPQPSNLSRGVRGHYFEWATMEVPAGEDARWKLVADTSLNQAEVARICTLVECGLPIRDLEEDVASGEAGLRRRLAGADALQLTADPIASAHHLSNVLFNVMRGGGFPGGYAIGRDDFAAFLRTSNRSLASRHAPWLATLPASMPRNELRTAVNEQGCPHLRRLFDEYLPLAFSRRHGDPSRPWNRFRIVTKDAHGQDILSFQGNWRDIFQNWEALALSYPEFLEGMIAKFVNASTVDGQNPYRITREGIDWEEPEPENPWAAFGYWGDHQIIYLLKLLEALAAHQPETLPRLLGARRHTYGNVPYRQKSFEEVLREPRHTLTFDHELSSTLRRRAASEGSDARLVTGEDGNPVLVSLMEKLLVPILAKWSAFVVDGGIWMNTQRPEWNDANNALVGNGLSIVTLCHLRRHQAFLAGVLHALPATTFEISAPVARWLSDTHAILSGFAAEGRACDDRRRLALLRELGLIADHYREAVYGRNPTSTTFEIGSVEVLGFLTESSAWADETIRGNRRADGLYNAYNLLRVIGVHASVRHLDPMLEGQVAVLGAGLLDAGACADLLDCLHKSPLFCPQRRTFMLYPDRPAKPFLEKNQVAPTALRIFPLLAAMMDRGDHRVVYPERASIWRFHPDLHHAGDLRARLRELAAEGGYGDIADSEVSGISELYEGVFNHHAFTGRSGSMFAYEGLGSVYWHMVSKLLLAVQEVLIQARDNGADSAVCARLDAHYEAIRDGLGYRKTAAEFGAFPTDPYSHTPAHAGAQQPGMTGQVKEEILTRRGELGVRVEGGCIRFGTIHKLLDREFLEETTRFDYLTPDGREERLPLPPGSLAFTVCQVPLILHRQGAGAAPYVQIFAADGRDEVFVGDTLPRTWSSRLFARDGSIRRIETWLAGVER